MPTVVIVSLFVGIVVGANWVVLNASDNPNQLVACATEDSDNCFWDAAVRGNGEGTSFVTLNGVTYYDVDLTTLQLPTK
jgi:hypothetical protein